MKVEFCLAAKLNLIFHQMYSAYLCIQKDFLALFIDISYFIALIALRITIFESHPMAKNE